LIINISSYCYSLASYK